MYVFYDANTYSQRKLMVGDYYYVRWYDAAPDKAARIVMRYTQAASGIKQKVREIKLPAGRGEAGARKAEFFFAGKDRQRLGDIMSLRIELYVGDELKDARQSYLWK